MTDRETAPPRDEVAGFGWVGSLWRGLAPLLRPHGGQLAAIGLLMAVELGLQLGQRKAFGTLVDDALLKADGGLVVLILLLLLVAAVVSGGAALLHEYLQAKLCASVPGEVRARLFEHTQRLPLSRLRTSTHGDLITRITSDAGSVEPALWSLGYVATASCGVVLALALLLWSDWRLALAGIALLPLALIGPRFLTPLAARESYAAKTAVGGLATHLQENLANQIVLRVFGLNVLAAQRFDAHNQRIITASLRYNVFSYFSHRVPWIAIELIDLVVLALGCWMVVRGDMTPGGLIAFYLLFSSLATHTYSLTAAMPGLIGASAGMRRITELLGMPAGPVPSGAAPVPVSVACEGDRAVGEGNRRTMSLQRPPAIAFERVSFRYASDAAADTTAAPADQLGDATFEIAAGRMTAFVGASGSGKSTALQLLLGLQTPRAGRVLVDGLDLAQADLQAYWSGVSAVFQDSLLFHATIAENVRAGRLDATDAQVAAAAQAAGIASWVDSLPEGYGTMVAGDTCSGGQRQRIAIARALVREPVLLVLDEPTSALDPATGRAVMQTLLDVSGGRTSVLVTHQLRDAARADHVVVFDRARVVEAGTHAQLLALGGVYAGLWAQQEQRALPA
ncbi:MAG: ABC transporter ATP-binding protein [Proteobacteria bacterium]|nr:ABC transporter ATP-binding protein [Pseudomonadota bacterium]